MPFAQQFSCGVHGHKNRKSGKSSLAKAQILVFLPDSARERWSYAASRAKQYAGALALAWLFLPGLAAALAADRDQPIHIQADRVEINEQTGVSIYRGDVKVTQGSMQLQADSVVVRRKGETLERIEAEGRPARFSQEQDGSGEPVRGEAKHIEYHTDTDLALLVGEGHVWRGRDEFRGERIEYDLLRNVVRATGGGGNGNRVHAVIHPKKKEPSP